ncbi:hypothetical protein BLA29_012811, partial [Euroglyphus maynei]
SPDEKETKTHDTKVNVNNDHCDDEPPSTPSIEIEENVDEQDEDENRGSLLAMTDSSAGAISDDSSENSSSHHQTQQRAKLSHVRKKIRINTEQVPVNSDSSTADDKTQRQSQSNGPYESLSPVSSPSSLSNHSDYSWANASTKSSNGFWRPY